jgi:hypothetical protein
MKEFVEHYQSLEVQPGLTPSRDGPKNGVLDESKTDTEP